MSPQEKQREKRIQCQIQEAPIDLNLWSSKLNQKSSGAVTWFLGNVRNRNQGQDVVGIAYEACIPLAGKILLEICREAQSRWGEELELLVLHRVGYLHVGECSVLIGVSSPHRAAAYEASRFVIEEIKKRAPIWKQEHYKSGPARWLKGQSLNEN